MKVVAGALVGAAFLGVAVTPAAAGGTTIIIGGGHFRHHTFHRHGFFVTHPHTRIIVVPQTVYVPYRRWVPGYWTYQWIPQVYTSYVWIPGYYEPNGYWVEGHYEPWTVQTGYYQPVWVSGYWLD